MHVDDRRDGATRWMPPCWPPYWSGVCNAPAGVELAEQARLANDALADQAGDGQFVTGLLVRLTWPMRRRASSTPAILRRSGCGPGRSNRFVWADRPFGLQPETAVGAGAAARGGRLG